MHEVIELLSSSPPQGSSREFDLPQISSRLNQSNVLRDVFKTTDSSAFGEDDLDDILNSGIGRKLKARLSQGSSPDKPKPKFVSMPSTIGSDDFRDSRMFDDSVLDDEFLSAQPAKRGRISPTPVTDPTRIQKSLAQVDTVFELSSEPDYHRPAANFPMPQENGVDVFDLSDYDACIPSFSSSAPPLQTSVVEARKDDDVIEVDFQDSIFFNDPILSSSQPVKTTKPKVLSERTTNLLANLKSSSVRTMGVTKPTSVASSIHTSSRMKTVKQKRTYQAEAEDVDTIIDSSQPARTTRSPVKPALPDSTKDVKAGTSKDKTKEQTRLDKEATKEQKRLEKEQKARDKQLAAEKADVNKKRTDKKKSAGEMIIEIPNTVKSKSLGNQIEELMKQVDVETRYYQVEVDMTSENPTPVTTGTLIKWRRKVKSQYNEELEEYESCPPRVEKEKHILVYLTAEEFCIIAVAGAKAQTVIDKSAPTEDNMKENIDTFITLLRSRDPGMTIVLLIQGLTAYLKKSVNTKNREYAAAVRAQTYDQDALSSSATTRPSKKRKPSSHQVDLSFLTNDHIDALTLHIQLVHQPLHIHHTTSIASSAQQISAFTQHLSTRPYRLVEQRHNLAHASFCMASGQFKTGQGNPTDTFIKMLEQVNRITPSMAIGIIAEGYETPKQLVEGFRKLECSGTGGCASLCGDTREEREGRERAKLMLQDVKKAVNKDGGYSDKRLGPAASRKMYRVFMSRDENLRDGII